MIQDSKKLINQIVQKQELKDKNLTDSYKMEVINNESKKTGFVKIKCHKCGQEMVIFGRASTTVECLNPKCSEVLAIPRGGKAAIKAEILELL